jgi:uroporphyrinogen-III synthase
VKPSGISEENMVRLKRSEVDMVIFSSPSSATNCVELFKQFGMPDLAQVLPAACIGPTTAETARNLGFSVVAQAAGREIGITGLVDLIRDYFSVRAPGA